MTPRTAALALLLAAAVAGLRATEAPVSTDLVSDVRSAIASGGLGRGDAILTAYRAIHGTTPEALDALVWLARGALADKLYEKASRYADDARRAAAAGVQRGGAGADPGRLRIVGSATEASALALVGQGARSDAVYLLRTALDDYRGTSIGGQIEAALAGSTLEGHTAPPIAAGVSAGARLAHSSGTTTLLFFWAHWCAECKSESAALARIADKYRPRGLDIVAPTRRYGYVENSRAAPPDRELRHIVQVRDQFYPFLRDLTVPVADANYKSYGVSAVPMHVLIDRQGIVRLYQPGVMSEAELDAAIARVLEF
jgi:hypothetical protein